jgi:hypothetical protein
MFCGRASCGLTVQLPHDERYRRVEFSSASEQGQGAWSWLLIDFVREHRFASGFLRAASCKPLVVSRDELLGFGAGFIY